MTRKLGDSKASQAKGADSGPLVWTRLKRLLRPWWAKVLAAASTILLLFLSGVFGRLGEGAVDGLSSIMNSPPSSPSATTSNVGLIPLSVAVSMDLGSPGDVLALKGQLTEGVEAANLLFGPRDLSWREFLARNEGSAVGSLVAEMTLTNTGTHPVSVATVQAVDVTTAPILDGTRIAFTTQGQVDVIPVEMNLDNARPTVRQGDAAYFDLHKIDLQGGEQAILRITAKAALHYVRWIFAVEYVASDGQLHTTFVDSASRNFTEGADRRSAQAFAVTGPSEHYQISYAENYPSSGFHVVS